MGSSNYFSAIQFIGTQRSGSNLLRVMLNQLPEISAPHPPHILKTFFPILPHYGDLSKKDNFYWLVSDVCEWVNLNPVPWDGIQLNPQTIADSCNQKTLVELFRRIYEEKAKLDGARYWCCKSMESIQYTSELEESGVNPFYVHIYRDGRDVALSFLKAIVGPKHIYHLAKKWNEEQALCLALKESLPRERFISIRYEDLIDHPIGVISDICKKLNIEYRENVMNYFYSRESLNTANSGTMWENVAKPILRNNHHKYLKELQENELMIFERIAGDMLVKLGYEKLTDTSKAVLTTEDIQRFNRENLNRILESEQLASDRDKEKRKPQEELLARIKSKANLVL